jgi:hypothetical protein
MKLFWETKNFHHNDRQCPFKSSFSKFYSCYNDIVCDYEVSLAYTLYAEWFVSWSLLVCHFRWLWWQVIPYTYFRLRVWPVSRGYAYSSTTLLLDSPVARYFGTCFRLWIWIEVNFVNLSQNKGLSPSGIALSFGGFGSISWYSILFSSDGSFSIHIFFGLQWRELSCWNGHLVHQNC